MNEKLEPGHDDHVLDHEYDGIQEYDNPLPRWWVWIFWATIAWSALYVLDVPWIGKGPGRIASYEREVAAAAKRYAAAQPAPVQSDDALQALAAVPAEVAKGKAKFAMTCTPCHGADGGGTIGPNLTDPYWIHGARPLEVYHTVHDGVPAKGMPTWGQVLPPDEIAAIVAYLLTLRGTTPVKAKGPEGVHADSIAALGGTPPVASVGAVAGSLRR